MGKEIFYLSFVFRERLGGEYLIPLTLTLRGNSRIPLPRFLTRCENYDLISFFNLVSFCFCYSFVNALKLGAQRNEQIILKRQFSKLVNFDHVEAAFKMLKEMQIGLILPGLLAK